MLGFWARVYALFNKVVGPVHSGLLWLGRNWARVRRILRVLRPAWLAGLLVLGVSAALHHPQALDALVDIAQKGALAENHVSLFLAVLAVALCGWYFPRALLYVKYWFTPEPDPPRAGDDRLPDLVDMDGLRVWVPRLLGFAPILSLALAFFRKDAVGFCVFYLLVAVVFGLFLRVRHKLIKKPGQLLPALPFGTAINLTLILLVSLVLLIVFLRSPVRFPQLLGPMAIVVYAAASWIAFGSAVLVYFTYRYEAPSMIVIGLVVIAIFGQWNDNHEIRRGTDDPVAWTRSPVDEHFGRWLRHRQEEWSKRFPGGEPYPVFLVAAEGGGIRAAYWTASVLARIEQENPGFACHVFAISGVSGGSLGGAVFTALTADALQDPGGYECNGSAVTNPPELLDRARQVLGKDFLGPALAGLFFPDLMQRFIPIGDRTFSGRFTFPDRAQYLERSWEVAWEDVTSSKRFTENFRQLWAGHELEVPSLFLNGTWVENGARNVTSNLRPVSPRFANLDDAVARLEAAVAQTDEDANQPARRPLPLSTAVHMSARFTYVSPAGTMPDGKWRVVDGGYFENSGSMTASEVLAVISESQGPLDFEPNVLIISNNTENPNNFDPGCGTGCEESEGGSSGVFRETLAPIQTLLKTRGARGFRAEEFLERSVERSVGEDNFYRFALPPSQRAEVPLGWILSEDSRSFMDCVIDDLDVEGMLPAPFVEAATTDEAGQATG